MRTIITIVTLIVLGAIGFDNRVEAQSVLGAGMFDSKSPVFSYTGTWATSTNAAYIGGSFQYTSENGARVEFYIFGESFTVYGNTFNGASSNSLLCIDSVCQTISYSSPACACPIVSVDGLSYGTHHIEIISQSTLQTNIDAVFVEDYQIEPTIQFEVIVTAEFTLPETTPEPLPGWIEEGNINGQPVVYEYSYTTGEQSIFLMIVVLVFITFVGVLIQIWNMKFK